MSVSQGIFRQYDIRGIVGRDLTAEVARFVGRGYAAYLASLGIAGPIAVGRDNRPSGDMLRDALVGGLTECGIDVVDVGVIPTPLLYWSLHHLGVEGGIQITGSHNPPEYNGFKMCVGTDSLHGEGIQRLYALGSSGPFPGGAGIVRNEEVIERYVADVARRIGRMPRALNVVIDCGNGAGALVADRLFDRLGLGCTYLFCESDGTFPNHHPD